MMLRTPPLRERLVTLAACYALLLLLLAAGADRAAVVWVGLALPLGFYCGWITHRDH